MTDEPDIVERLRAPGWFCEDDLLIAAAEIERLRKELDEARMRTGRILNEIDCRIEHGAESNGHLEAIHNLFKENNNA